MRPRFHSLLAIVVAWVAWSAAPAAHAFEGFNGIHILAPVVDEGIQGARASRINIDIALSFDRRWRPPDGELPPWVRATDRPARLVATTRMTMHLVIDHDKKQPLRVRVPYTAASNAAFGIGPAHPDDIEVFLNDTAVRVQASDEAVVQVESVSRHFSSGGWTKRGKTELTYTFVIKHGVASREIFAWQNSQPRKGFKALVDKKTKMDIHVHSQEPWLEKSQLSLEVVGDRGVVASRRLPFAAIDKAIAKRLKLARKTRQEILVSVATPGRPELSILDRREAEAKCQQRPGHHYVWRHGLCLHE